MNRDDLIELVMYTCSKREEVRGWSVTLKKVSGQLNSVRVTAESSQTRQAMERFTESFIPRIRIYTKYNTCFTTVMENSFIDAQLSLLVGELYTTNVYIPIFFYTKIQIK